MVRVVFISDTHNLHSAVAVPPGDILIHCGDATVYGDTHEILNFNTWLGTQPHTYKIFVPGNHDLGFEDNFYQASALLNNADYILHESGADVMGLKIWGSGWTPWFHDWAFNYRLGKKDWLNIPIGLDVLITHGPPFGIGDLTARGNNAGCTTLLDRVLDAKPKVHVFGHIHERAGTDITKQGVRFCNVAALNAYYEPNLINCLTIDF